MSRKLSPTNPTYSSVIRLTSDCVYISLTVLRLRPTRLNPTHPILPSRIPLSNPNPNSILKTHLTHHPSNPHSRILPTLPQRQLGQSRRSVPLLERPPHARSELQLRTQSERGDGSVAREVVWDACGACYRGREVMLVIRDGCVDTIICMLWVMDLFVTKARHFRSKTIKDWNSIEYLNTLHDQT